MVEKIEKISQVVVKDSDSSYSKSHNEERDIKPKRRPSKAKDSNKVLQSAEYFQLRVLSGRVT